MNVEAFVAIFCVSRQIPYAETKHMPIECLTPVMSTMAICNTCKLNSLCINFLPNQFACASAIKKLLTLLTFGQSNYDSCKNSMEI